MSNRDLRDRYLAVRKFSESLLSPLKPEDCVVQSMPDVSPTRWHLAHTTWFFETFVLRRFQAGYLPVDPAYEHLFNSYYNSVGEQFPRSRRGLLSRPTVQEVCDYRRAVDERMVRFLDDPPVDIAATADVLEVGLQHEQQHQELMLTDIKHVFSCHPQFPVYRASPPSKETQTLNLGWKEFEEGLQHIGFSGDGFTFDNEMPQHRVFMESFQLADRLVTSGDYLDFLADGGYTRPELWLSAGWAEVQASAWRAPLYWQQRDGEWWQFTLGGLRPVRAAEPVCHVSYYEADAYARWAGVRLPTEAEWEIAAAGQSCTGNFVESETLHPLALREKRELNQMFGDVWEWTASGYSAYPGYKAASGALGEYNGKFMCNQFVLRGGSCATSQPHIRPTYRNFFPPEARWQFSGIRLAK